MDRPQLSVAVPAYNEEDNLEPVVESLLAWALERGIAIEVVIVDDGSVDGTLARAKSLADRHPQVKVAVHELNRGLGAAMWTGMSAATGDLVTWVPSDGQIESAQIGRMLDAIADLDAVTTYYTNLRPDSLARRIMSKVHRTLVRILDLKFKWRIQGPMMIRRQAMEGLKITVDTGLGETELAVRAFRRGARFGAVGIEIRERLSGQSKVANLRTIFKLLWELVGLKWALTFRK